MTYAETARRWLAAGFGPLPLPAGKKHAPPTGWTGKGVPMPSAADVAAWSEDHADGNVALRLPPHVVALDVDAYDGRPGWSTLLAAVGRRGALPPTHRISPRDDGQSGHYLYRLPAGVTDDGFVAELAGGGVDVLRHGHRYSIAPGSTHPSGAAYRLFRPDGTEAAGVVRVDDLPELPAPWVDELRRPAVTAVPAVYADEVPDRSSLSEAECRRLDRYADNIWTAELKRLDECSAAAKPGGQGYRGPAWNATSFEVACTLLQLANSPWCELTEQRVYQMVKQHAPRDRGFTDADVDKCFKSALDRIGTKARPLPVDRTVPPSTGGAVDPFEDLTGGVAAAAPVRSVAGQEETGQGSGDKAERSGAGKDGSSHAALVIEHVGRHYDLGLSPHGEPFAVPKSGARLPIMLGAKGGAARDRVTAELYDLPGRVVVGDKALSGGLSVVVARARALTETTPLHLRCIFDGYRVVIDLGQANSTRCVVINPAGWTAHDVPPDGLLFRRTAATHPLPEPQPGGSLDPLREVLGFEPLDSRWQLVRGWLVASPLADIPRPLLMPLGAPGSAKTSRGRVILNVLDPREQLGSSFGRNLDDDQVKALGRYLVGYDNLTSISETISDHVCRLVTGDAAEKRRNYSDTEQVVMTYRRTGVLTAVTLPALRADALERVIPLHLDRVSDENRVSERKVGQAFTQAHPAILGGLCDAIAAMLRRLPALVEQDPPGPRMKDYWLALLAYDPACAEAYREAVDNVMTDAAEDDPFVCAVRAWLTSLPGWSFAGPPGDAYAMATHQRNQAGAWSSRTWWPKRAAEFGKALTNATEPLRAVGIVFAQGKSNGHRVLSIQLAADHPRRLRTVSS